MTRILHEGKSSQKVIEKMSYNMGRGGGGLRHPEVADFNWDFNLNPLYAIVFIPTIKIVLIIYLM